MDFKKLLFCTTMVLATSLNLMAAKVVGIIPKPQSATISQGQFTLNKGARIVQIGSSEGSAKALQTGISDRFALATTVVSTKTNSHKGAIVLEKIEAMAAEEYAIQITNDAIYCRATTEVGMFYGVQSLLQVFEKNNNKIVANCMEIKDKPLYSWRGFMLDEARHFMGKEAVMQYLDVMATLKMNRFHWHLTDDEGWRIEIKKYPKLTQIGSIGSSSNRKSPSAFYTQEEIKEIVAYAAERHIEIMPEIDMPGHATAATRSYPELSGGGEGRWAGFTFNPVKESTYQFIEDVVAELTELFPGRYIHIGADEVHYGNQSWFTDPEFKKFIRDNYLMDESGLEHYFVRRVCQIVNDKGKIMVGWDEIFNAGITPDKAVIMWWRQERPDMLTQPLAKGFDVIMNPRLPAYLDFVQHPTHKIGRRWSAKFNPLDAVYQFPELYSNLVGKRSGQILGVQSVLFTETVADKNRLDFLVFPRLLAMAENGWTTLDNKNYPDFERRVKGFMPYLDMVGIKYFNLFDPASTPEAVGPTKKDVIANG